MTKAKFTNVTNEDDLHWKRTSDGILPQISKVKYLSKNWSDLMLMRPKQTLQICKMNITSNVRRLQMEEDLRWNTTTDIKSGISQQLLVRSTPNYKLWLM